MPQPDVTADSATAHLPPGDLFDRLPAGVVCFADDSSVIQINTTLLERLDYARADVVGRHVEQILSVGSRIFHQTHFFPLVKLHGHAQEIFMLLRARGGEEVPVICNATRHERDGQFVTVCVFMEVNERRKFEDALVQARQAADTANATLAARSRELENANAKLESQAIELEAQHQQLQEQATELELQSEALGGANDELEVLNADLRKERAAADEANNAKSSFLAVMSHELRTPLNAISGYVQLLDMGVHGPITEPQRETLERIARSQRHLLRLINDILNLSRIEAGRVDYRIEPISLTETVDSVLPMVEPQRASGSLQLSATVPPTLMALADREKVQQIVLNLLTNAIKFTAAGGVITIDGGSDESMTFLRVADTGKGIPEDMLDRVFEPFIQVDIGRSRAAEGTGLGLAISRDLARGMAGDLTATSVLGKGSTFRLTLPAA